MAGDLEPGSQEIFDLKQNYLVEIALLIQTIPGEISYKDFKIQKAIFVIPPWYIVVCKTILIIILRPRVRNNLIDFTSYEKTIENISMTDLLLSSKSLKVV